LVVSFSLMAIKKDNKLSFVAQCKKNLQNYFYLLLKKVKKVLT